MKRFFWYKVGFLITLLLYPTFKLIGFSLADSIVSLMYFLSSILFVFTTEELPKEHLNIPQVHKYYKSRINLYGYIITTVLVLSALVFGIVYTNTTFPVGIISLLCWSAMIGTVYLYMFLKLNEKIDQNMITDFILRNMSKESRIENVKLKMVIQKFKTHKIVNKVELKKFEKEFKKIDFDVLEEIFDLYEKYLEDSEELISDEINEL